jgi:hypothetical protein
MSKLALILRISLAVLMAISVIFVFIFYFGNAVPGTEGTEFYEPLITEGMLRWTYILLFMAVAAAIGFPLAYIISHPETAKKTLVSVAVLAVVGLIAYLLADDTVLTLADSYDGSDNVPNTLRWVGTGIISTYLLLAVAIGAIVVTSVTKLIKR